MNLHPSVQSSALGSHPRHQPTTGRGEATSNLVNDGKEKDLDEPDEEPDDVVPERVPWPFPPGEGGLLELKGDVRAEVLDGHAEAGAEAIFVGALSRPGSRIRNPARVLDLGEALLGREDGLVEDCVPVCVPPLDGLRVGLVQRVEGDEDVPKGRAGDFLEDVHVVCEADLVNVARAGHGGGPGKVVE